MYMIKGERMKIIHVSLFSLVCSMGVLHAGPQPIRVQNSNKNIKVQLQTDKIVRIPGQPEYVLEPYAVQVIKVPDLGKYRLVVTFVGLERGGYITIPFEVTPTTTSLVIPDQTKNYNNTAAYIKQLDTPEPTVHGGDW